MLFLDFRAWPSKLSRRLYVSGPRLLDLYCIRSTRRANYTWRGYRPLLPCFDPSGHIFEKNPRGGGINHCGLAYNVHQSFRLGFCSLVNFELLLWS